MEKLKSGKYNIGINQSKICFDNYFKKVKPYNQFIKSKQLNYFS